MPITQDTGKLSALGWTKVVSDADHVPASIGRVIGIDTGEEKRKLSMSLGCEAFVDFKQTPDLATEIKSISEGLGAHAAIIAAATSAAYEQALGYLRPRGTLVAVGMPNGVLPVSVLQMVAMTLRIVGSAVGNRHDVDEALDIAARGHVKVQYQTKGLSDLPQVFTDMKEGKISGRIVLDIDN